MAICPYCAEEIQELAIKCKHCKEWLSEIDNDNTLSEREGELCPDGTCTGHIYDGVCSTCGLPAEEAFKIEKTRRRIPPKNLEGELCPDGTCTGHIYGGICTTCGLSVDAHVANNTDIIHKDKYIERNVHCDIISTNEHLKHHHTSDKKNKKIAILLLIMVSIFLVIHAKIQDKKKYNIFLKSIDEHYEQIIENKENAPNALEIISKFEKHDLLNYKDVSSIKEEMQAAALKAKEEAKAEAIKANEAAAVTAIKEKEDKMRLDAFVYMQQFVRGSLLSPRGAKFARASVYWRQHVQYLGDGRYLVRSYVDAQNAFGGTVRQNYSGVISKKDDKWELEYLNM